MTACKILSETPCRAFVCISNKKNVIGYKKVQIMENREWLYWWITRVLMEKVTDYCSRHANEHKIINPKIRFVFSRRGGKRSYDHLRAYLRRLQSQSEAGGLFINHSDIKWDLIDHNQIHVVDSKQLVGLQLADIVAGAFFNALDISKLNTSYAEQLKPIMASCSKNKVINYGLKTMPYIYQIPMKEEQRELFSKYGYKGRWTLGL